MSRKRCGHWIKPLALVQFTVAGPLKYHENASSSHLMQRFRAVKFLRAMRVNVNFAKTREVTDFGLLAKICGRWEFKPTVSPMKKFLSLQPNNIHSFEQKGREECHRGFLSCRNCDVVITSLHGIGIES